jgi:hypothetical protein
MVEMRGPDEESVEEPESLDPAALDRAFEAWTVKSGKGRGAGKKLPRRTLSFLVDAETCAPGVFEADFRLELRGLTSAVELQCAQKSGGDPAKLAYLLAFESVFSFNGRPLGVTHREWLWEALGSAGRNLVVGQFGTVGTPADEALKKASETLRVG